MNSFFYNGAFYGCAHYIRKKVDKLKQDDNYYCTGVIIIHKDYDITTL